MDNFNLILYVVSSFKCLLCTFLPYTGHALVDLMQRPDEAPPECNSKVLCRHPFQENKRAFVCPSKVERLHKVKTN